MKTKATEKEIEKYLIDKVKKVGGRSYKFNSPSNAGVPDRVVIINSYVFFVELKTPTGRLSARQAQALNELRHCYMINNTPVHRCAVLSSFAEVNRWVEHVCAGAEDWAYGSDMYPFFSGVRYITQYHSWLRRQPRG